MYNKGIVLGHLIVNNATDEEFNPYPNVDSKYGPYETIEHVLTELPLSVRSIGLTVGIKTNDNIIEYWFNGGIENIHFTKKQLGEQGLPGDVYVPELTTNYFNE